MIKPKILATGRFSPEDIKIKFNRKSKRKIDPEIEETCKELWKEFYKKSKEEGKVIYDGTSYRLDRLNKKGKSLEIEISRMKFSTKKPLNIQIDKLEKYGFEYFPNTIAIGGPLHTKDNKFIFGEKSGNTVSLTNIDIIGGIAETETNLSKGKDLYKVVEKEMFEETNVSMKHLDSFQFLGIILSPWANIIFVIIPILKIKSQEVLKLFKDRRDPELSKLIVVDKENIIEYLENLGGYKPQVAKMFTDLGYPF